MQSIGLIQKTSYPLSKKPAFLWIGIEGVIDFVTTLKRETRNKDLKVVEEESCPTVDSTLSKLNSFEEGE